jgi:hypothetical protein
MAQRNPQKPEWSIADTQPTRRRGPAGGDGVDRGRLEMLLHQARTAGSPEEALEYVQRAVDMLPNDPRVQSTAQLRLFDKLSSDAFLGFLAETANRYVVEFRDSRPFSVPKARAEPEPYPPVRRTEAEKAVRMMWWMILGLIPAGLGAIVLAPFALRHGIRSLQNPSETQDPRQHRLAWMGILVALGLGVLGVFCAALLLLHLLLG